MNSYIVLLCEDELELNMTLLESLDIAGFKVVTCSSGSSAGARISTTKFDAIITDIQLPGFSGLELTKIIRASEINRDTLVIVISGHIDATAATKVRQYGVKDVLVKPFLPSELINRIKERLEQKRVVSLFDKNLIKFLIAAVKESFSKILEGMPEIDKPEVKVFAHKNSFSAGRVNFSFRNQNGSLDIVINEKLAEILIAKTFAGEESVLDLELHKKIVGDLLAKIQEISTSLFENNAIKVNFNEVELFCGQENLGCPANRPALLIPMKWGEARLFVDISLSPATEKRELAS